MTEGVRDPHTTRIQHASNTRRHIGSGPERPGADTDPANPARRRQTPPTDPIAHQDDADEDGATHPPVHPSTRPPVPDDTSSYDRSRNAPCCSPRPAPPTRRHPSCHLSSSLQRQCAWPSAATRGGCGTRAAWRQGHATRAARSSARAWTQCTPGRGYLSSRIRRSTASRQC